MVGPKKGARPKKIPAKPLIQIPPEPCRPLCELRNRSKSASPPPQILATGDSCPGCLQYKSQTVDTRAWILCDICGKWWYQNCVPFNIYEVTDAQPFTCGLCWAPTQATQPSASASASVSDIPSASHSVTVDSSGIDTRSADTMDISTQEHVSTEEHAEVSQSLLVALAPGVLSPRRTRSPPRKTTSTPHHPRGSSVPAALSRSATQSAPAFVPEVGPIQVAVLQDTPNLNEAENVTLHSVVEDLGADRNDSTTNANEDDKDTPPSTLHDHIYARPDVHDNLLAQDLRRACFCLPDLDEIIDTLEFRPSSMSRSK
jgi:hypothetical protein